MAILQNWIGSFAFIRLDGHADKPSPQLEIAVRQGVSGVGLWLTGNRGRPFRLRSFVDVETLGLARRGFALYTTLKGSNPVGLIWNSYNMSNENFNVAVLDVRAIDIRSVANASGGLNAPSGAILVADWTLLAIELDQEEG